MRKRLLGVIAAGFIAVVVATAGAATPRITQNISSGQALSGTYAWTATYFNSSGVSADPGRVEFYVDGLKVGQDKTKPFAYSLVTSSYSNGSHDFKVRAMNGTTQRAVNSVSALVSNAPPPLAACADELDNDADGLVDYPSDPGCSSSADDNEQDAVSGEPVPIAGQGYHVAFADEFDSLDSSVWDNAIWYDDPPSSSWTGFQSAENGVLHLRTSRAYHYNEPCSGDRAEDPGACNWPINTVSTHSSGRTFQYGYFEARMKWTAGAGAWPAFWLVSQGWANTGSCTTPAGELDVFEGQGTEPNVFYGTVHRNASGSCNSQYPDDQNGNNYQETNTNLTAGFHDYGMLWTPGHVSWYLDGVKLMDSDAYYSTLDQPMMLLLQEWTCGWTTCPGATSPDVLENQVDWVHVWQK